MPSDDLSPEAKRVLCLLRRAELEGVELLCRHPIIQNVLGPRPPWEHEFVEFTARVAADEAYSLTSAGRTLADQLLAVEATTVADPMENYHAEDQIPHQARAKCSGDLPLR